MQVLPSGFPPCLQGLRKGEEGRDKEANVRIVAMHGQPGLAPFGMLKGMPPVNQTDIFRGNTTSAGLGGGTSAERGADAICFMHQNICWD